MAFLNQIAECKHAAVCVCGMKESGGKKNNRLLGELEKLIICPKAKRTLLCFFVWEKKKFLTARLKSRWN